MKYMLHENKKNIHKEMVEHIQLDNICQSCCSTGYQAHKDNKNCTRKMDQYKQMDQDMLLTC